MKKENLAFRELLEQEEYLDQKDLKETLVHPDFLEILVNKVQEDLKENLANQEMMASKVTLDHQVTQDQEETQGFKVPLAEK